VIPNKYEGMDATDLSPEVLKKTLNDLVPQEHIDFAKKILADHGVPVDHSDDDALQLLGWTEATATPQVEVALAAPIECTLIANALGTPPAEMIKHIHDTGRKVAALCGSPSQARKHADAGVDIIIAQGGEAGGHCGEVGSIVLWPQVVQEVAPVPVLAAGGIGSGQQIAAALALGAQGAWTGSQWVMVEEVGAHCRQHAAYAKASSRDTVRSRSFTGKPARMLKNDWTEAWENADNPKPLGMPLQVHGVRHGRRRHAQVPQRECRRRVSTRSARSWVSSPRWRSPRRGIERWVQEYLEATKHLERTQRGGQRLIAAACGGFLLAVLWMDLIFDDQVLRHRGAGRTTRAGARVDHRLLPPCERRRHAR